MRSLVLNDIAYNIGIRVYCNDCKTLFDPRTEKGKVRKKECTHAPAKQVYRSTICVPFYGGKRKRKAHKFDSRNLDEVINEGFSFKQEVKNNATQAVQSKKQEKPMLLIDCLAMFLDYKHGVGVAEHLKKELDPGTLREFNGHITKWKDATTLAGEDFERLRADSISEENISATIKHLSTWSNSTQKKAFGFYNQFYRYLNKNGYGIPSPFEGIEVSDAPSEDARAITNDEFEKVKKAMECGSSDDRVKTRKRHHDWLVESMNLAALTGRRREEFMLARFSDIRLIEGEILGGFIWMLDSKYSRQNKHKIGFKPRYTKAPIFPELRDFLLSQGYEEQKDSDRYIVAGDEVKQRNTLADNLTDSFGFYRGKVGLKDEVKLKGLRKKYITRMRNEFGDNANFFTGHKSSRIDMKHYYDDSEIFEKVKEFKLWK
ncbi:MAG: hypothetical protein QNK23_14345 [Crocinitomicaceae bacterium]|nr:hypothetical protein [Crocinitomicaceae bacterium]